MRNPRLTLVLAVAWLCRWLAAEENGVEPHGWPKCNSCMYGDCISPGSCRCWPGYMWQELPLAGCRPLAQLLLPTEQCLDHCPGRCWRPQQEHKPRCFRICHPGQSKPELELEPELCLQAEECVCNSLTQSLICQNKDQERPQQYACLQTAELQQGEVPQILPVKVRRSENTENWNSARGIHMDKLMNRTNRRGDGVRNNSMGAIYYANDRATTMDQNSRIPLPGEPIKDSTLILAILIFFCIIIIIIVVLCIFTAQLQQSGNDEL